VTRPIERGGLGVAAAPASAPAVTASGRAPTRHRVGHLFRNRQVLAGGLVVLAAMATALASVAWTPHPYQEQELGRSLLPPFWMAGAQAGFPLGTDLNGRDL
jgi:ABC-type antimicrobial peptide transport system permease subunit